MKTIIAIASAAIGIIMFAGAVKELKASSGVVIIPGDDVPCYHNLWTCSYEDSDSYWSGCDPNYREGEITTMVAKAICTTYHQS
jgi:hypothetical protein